MRRAQLVVFGVLLGLCGVEAVLRVRLAVRVVREKRARPPSVDRIVSAQPEQTWLEYDEITGWKNKPGAVCESCFGEHSASVHINAGGVRGTREIPFERTPGVRRILVIGDSVGFGHAVGDDETFAARLQQLLPRTEVLNLAVTAYGLDQTLLLYERLGARYKPDDVLIVQGSAFSRIDLYEWGFGYARPRFRLRDGRLWLTNVPVPLHVPPGAAAIGLRATSAREILRLLLAPGYQTAAFARELRSRPDADDPINQRLGSAILARLAGDAKSSGARLAWVFAPQIHWLHRRTPGDFHATMEALSRSLGIGFIDLMPDFERARDPEGLYWDREPNGRIDPHAAHWTPRGHRLAAEGAARWLLGPAGR